MPADPSDQTLLALRAKRLAAALLRDLQAYRLAGTTEPSREIANWDAPLYWRRRD